MATVVFAVSAATALAAAPVWQNCAEATERGLLENSKCTTKGSKKAFEWLETNTTAEAVTSLGKIKLTDTSTG
ncbi:MAG TPA: hypothetical protein VEW68_11645, partial [Patescibacteria group bacterium]|nr:hypothetical protein [Patescibacteria group bacterium]